MEQRLGGTHRILDSLTTMDNLVVLHTGHALYLLRVLLRLIGLLVPRE
jgi:hypothetical protein